MAGIVHSFTKRALALLAATAALGAASAGTLPTEEQVRQKIAEMSSRFTEYEVSYRVETLGIDPSGALESSLTGVGTLKRLGDAYYSEIDFEARSYDIDYHRVWRSTGVLAPEGMSVCETAVGGGDLLVNVDFAALDQQQVRDLKKFHTEREFLDPLQAMVTLQRYPLTKLLEAGDRFSIEVFEEEGRLLVRRQSLAYPKSHLTIKWEDFGQGLIGSIESVTPHGYAQDEVTFLYDNTELDGLGIPSKVIVKKNYPSGEDSFQSVVSEIFIASFTEDGLTTLPAAVLCGENASVQEVK